MTFALARVARVPWWRRLLLRLYPARKPTEFCARCGCVRDDIERPQRLPRGTRTVCAGTITMARTPGGPKDWTFCIRLDVRLG